MAESFPGADGPPILIEGPTGCTPYRQVEIHGESGGALERMGALAGTEQSTDPPEKARALSRTGSIPERAVGRPGCTFGRTQSLDEEKVAGERYAALRMGIQFHEVQRSQTLSGCRT